MIKEDVWERINTVYEEYELHKRRLRDLPIENMSMRDELEKWKDRQLTLYFRTLRSLVEGELFIKWDPNPPNT